jgi:hypothetical protein
LKKFNIILVHPTKRLTTSLPPIELAPPQITDAACINQGVRVAFGIEAIVLKRLSAEKDESKRFQSYQYALRAASDDLPRDFVWRNDADTNMVFEQIDQVRFSQPWADPKWWAATMTWIETECAKAGLAKVVGCSQVRAWDLSVVLRVELADGECLFYKSVPPAFAPEAALTTWIANKLPQFGVEGRGPKVVVCDHNKHAMLLRACVGTQLALLTDFASWQTALIHYGSMQLATTQEVEKLVGLGVPLRTLDWLEAAWKRLVLDDASLKPNTHADFSDQEVTALRQLDERVVAGWIKTLKGFNIPLTLEHGDFYSLNVFLGQSGTEVIDWTDSSVTHPFFSLATYLRSIDHTDGVKDVPDIREKLAKSYLSCWTRYATLEALEAAIPDILGLSAVFQAVHYRERIAPLADTYEEVFSAIPAYARMVLARVS